MHNNTVIIMKIRLGYACISNIIATTSSKTTTLTYYKKLDSISKQNKLDKIINENLDNLKEIIFYNIKSTTISIISEVVVLFCSKSLSNRIVLVQKCNWQP